MLLSEEIKNSIRDVNNYPKSGIVFKDLTPVLANPALMRKIISEFVEKYKGDKLDAIVAVEARGFIFGAILAHELDCKFIPARKAGKLPYETISQEYALEYGTAKVEMHNDAIQPKWRVLIHDDLLATGGTACAAGNLVKALGGEVVGFSFLINLNFLAGKTTIKERFGLDPHFLVEY